MDAVTTAGLDPPLRLTGRVWRDGQLIDSDVRADEIPKVAQDADCLMWVDLVSPTMTQLGELIRRLGLPATATEDALAPHERPKLTLHDSHLFFTIYVTALDHDADPGARGRLGSRRLSGIVLPSALVTIRLDDSFDLAHVIERWSEDTHLLRYGVSALVYDLMDVVVDGHFETIQQLDDEIEALEDVLFDERRTGHDFQRRLYSLRKDLVALRRAVLPMREVVSGLLRHQQPIVPELQAWYDDLYDHVLRASEWTESVRDMVASMFETNLSLQDARLNIVMKKLAGWAAIIAVPTAITGWFGQNLPYPGYAQPSGLYLSTALIVVGVLGLYVAFKRRDWL